MKENEILIVPECTNISPPLFTIERNFPIWFNLIHLPKKPLQPPSRVNHIFFWILHTMRGFISRVSDNSSCCIKLQWRKHIVANCVQSLKSCLEGKTGWIRIVKVCCVMSAIGSKISQPFTIFFPPSQGRKAGKNDDIDTAQCSEKFKVLSFFSSQDHLGWGEEKTLDHKPSRFFRLIYNFGHNTQDMSSKSMVSFLVVAISFTHKKASQKKKWPNLESTFFLSHPFFGLTDLPLVVLNFCGQTSDQKSFFLFLHTVRSWKSSTTTFALLN